MTPKEAYYKAKKSGKRIPELEGILLKDAVYSYLYAKEIIKGIWELAEPVISQDAFVSYCYAKNVIKGKLPDFMHNQMILENDKYAKEYIEFISKNLDSPNNNMTPKEAYAKAYNLDKRMPKLEPTISKDAFYSYLYAKNVIEGKFILAEPVISKDAGYSYCYARDVIKGKWELAELTISKDAYLSFLYAKDVIKGRWELAESTISKDAQCSYCYAKYVIGGKLPDFIHNEMILSNHEYAKQYIKFIK